MKHEHTLKDLKFAKKRIHIELDFNIRDKWFGALVFLTYMSIEWKKIILKFQSVEYY